MCPYNGWKGGTADLPHGFLPVTSVTSVLDNTSEARNVIHASFGRIDSALKEFIVSHPTHQEADDSSITWGVVQNLLMIQLLIGWLDVGLYLCWKAAFKLACMALLNLLETE